MARITDREDWFDLWFQDRECITSTMVRNLASDLSVGYDYFGKSARTQREQIERYKEETNRTLDQFKNMDEKAVNRWCFYELKKRGAIE